MANKRIKGITINIDGNATNLNNALKSVDKQIYNTNSELKDLNKALKIDPSNVELLAQKQELLKTNIKNSTDRLNDLKKAQKEMGDYNSLTDEQKEKYRALSVEIVKTEGSIKSMNEELKKTKSIDLSGLKTGLEKVGKVALNVSKELAKITGAIGGALSSVVGLGVKSYAELEQNLGGIDTLFKESEAEIKEYEKMYGQTWDELKNSPEGFTTAADQLKANAKEAYKTAGVSANQYMSGVMGFASSLLQATKGNAWDAMEISDMAYKDMSDNANKFGTDMSSIQNAYQGFAKGQYQLLDNLKLGYGGTKKEMERLLADAEKLSGKKYDISNLADVYSAIHVIQEELGVTGTTAEEAEKTITGSVSSMKASFDNFINGSGGADDLIESVNNVLINVSNAILKVAPNILSGVPKLISNLLPKIIEIITGLVPQLLSAITEMIQTLFNQLTDNKDILVETITTLISDFVKFINDNLPTILEAGITILLALVQGIIDSLPTLIDSALELIDTLVDTLIDNLDEIIDAGIELLIALTEGLVDALPRLIAKVPEIINKLVEALCKPEMLLKLVAAALRLMIELAKGLVEAIPELLKIVPDIINGLVNNFKNVIKETDWSKLGGDIMKGIVNGLLSVGTYVKNKVNEAKDYLSSKLKSAFGISSPSKLMKKEVGVYLAQGIGEGFTDEMKKVSSNMTVPVDDLIGDYKSALSSLTHGINASVNPTINPRITYEQNYELMSKAMKEALNDMVVDLDDREVGRFVSKTITQEVYGR